MIETLVGIDFGTTFTVISLFINNKTEIINSFPSQICYYNNKFYCGNDIPLCNNETPLYIHSFKLDICKNKKYNVLDKLYDNNDMLDIFFKYIVDNIKYPNINAVITVPSHFYDNQRNIIKHKFESLGINVLRLLNEPTAAAIAYGLNYSLKDDEKILVVDIGGGTSDFTISTKSDNLFEILYSYGINDLGGNNITNLLINHYNISWDLAEHIKKELSSYEIVKINDNINISQSYFNKLITIFINKIKIVLENIHNLYNDISYIILVGGTNYIPIIQNTIQDVFNIKPWVHPNILYVVSFGASLYAGILKNKYTISNDILILDILPQSLGVELADGTYSIIVPKNSSLPTKMSQKYTTDSPDSENIIIKLYQGDMKLAKNNFLIKEINIIKDKLDCNPIIEIEYKIDINSIITVNIINKKNGDNKSIIINNIVNNIINDDIDDYDELYKSQLIYNISNLSTQKYHFDEMTTLELLSLLTTLKNNLDLNNNSDLDNNNFELDNNNLELDNNNFETENYKLELTNLYNYLCNEIENGNIINDKLSLLLCDVNELINNNSNSDNMFWKECLDDFNNKCEQLGTLSQVLD